MRKKLRELQGWPAQVRGGAKGLGTEQPVGIDDDRVTQVFQSKGTTLVTMRGQLDVSYHFSATDEKTAEKVYNLVRANIGKTVWQLGDLEIATE
jgi:hypothetical protein